MKEKLWKLFSDFFCFLEMVLFVIMIASLCFALGHHIGFKSGLDTKVTYVGERYIMKLKNDKKPETSKSSQINYGKTANLPKERPPDMVEGPIHVDGKNTPSGLGYARAETIPTDRR